MIDDFASDFYSTPPLLLTVASLALPPSILRPRRALPVQCTGLALAAYNNPTTLRARVLVHIVAQVEWECTDGDGIERMSWAGVEAVPDHGVLSR